MVSEYECRTWSERDPQPPWQRCDIWESDSAAADEVITRSVREWAVGIARATRTACQWEIRRHTRSGNGRQIAAGTTPPST